MKKPLIAAIATLAVAAGAQAESKFYGKMNVSLNYSTADLMANPTKTPETAIQSHASRLGVKGSEDLGASKIIYQAEYETDIDGDGSVLKQRDAYVGLTYNGMGTVKMGVMDTPLKKSQGKFDLFNDVFDMKRGITGDNRLANSLNYTTEKIGPVQVSVSYILAEDHDETDGLVDDGISASVTFKQGDLYASVAIDDKTEDADTATQRATVIYSLGDIRLGALINIVDQSDTASASADDTAFAVNASMKMGKNTLKAQYAASEQGVGVNKTGPALGATALNLGVDHKLGKATKAYAYLDMIDSDVTDTDVTTVAFGLEHKF